MRRPVSRRASRVVAALLVLAPAAAAHPQQSGPAAVPVRAKDPVEQSEIVTHETQPAFKLQSERNLVVLHVVVLDSKGQVVRNLQKDDFRLYDNGKLQTILQFSAENPVSVTPAALIAHERQARDVQPETSLAPTAPQRFLALYFDDVHMEVQDTMRIQAAAHQYLAGATGPGDRVGIFTSSGQGIVDFNQDRTAVARAISHLMARPITPNETNPCPRIYPYQAYQIVHEREPYASEDATQEALRCRFSGDTRFLSQAEALAQAQALNVLENWETESEDVLRVLDSVVRRMSVLPGQRTVVLVSPGFLTLTKEYALDQIVDHALRSSITISSLDSRGLSPEIPYDDMNQQTLVMPDRPDLMGHKTLSKINEFARDADVLRDLARDTGGFYFHNNNDLVEGFRKTCSLATAYYVLAFSPQALKADGRFHTLKVELAATKGFTIEARRGYFAPKNPADSASQAKDEIEEAIFSQNETLQLPIDVHTQFFKTGQFDARLAVLTHLDLHPVPFLKEEGRNLEKLTFVTALFDRDGHYVAGKETHIDFRLLDTSLEKLRNSGLTVKGSFDVRPGTYLIRQVVRDAQGGQLSGVSRTIEIPY